ncbi:MAG: ABC transporter ATP-binding protein [Actinomycetales bacterium]|nr:MAG: ABC transporter ATP-binding protein [Actinomycetales bacterium]
MIKIEGISVFYRKVPALVDVSISVGQGELIGLIGPNGAGKSTLVKAIAGLVKPTSGTILFEGIDLRGKYPEDIARLGVSFVPEGRHIFQSLSVAENLSLGYASGTAHDQDAHESVLDQFPALRRYYNDSAAGLSGGEQQQLAFARALLAKPKLLVLDEPSLGLAPLVIDSVFATLQKLRANGVTILLVEQNASRTIAIADRTYVLGGGKIRKEGTSSQLLDREDMIATYLGKKV